MKYLLFFIVIIMGFSGGLFAQVATPIPPLEMQTQRLPLKLGLMFLSGAADGMTQVIAFHPDRFFEMHPGADRQFWDNQISWRNKYRNGDPAQGRAYYVTAMVGEVDSVHKRRQIDYKGIQVDEDYLSMVFEARKKGRVFVLTETLRAGTMLKSFYQEERVKFAEIHYLCSTPDATYFISFASYDETHLQPSWGAILRCVSEVRKTLRGAFPNAK